VLVVEAGWPPGRLEHLRGSPRVQEPHQLHRPQPAGDRRPQATTTPSNRMSPFAPPPRV